MNCPHCNSPLQMSERQGVEIDYCPKCRGVWLDRGELDKILERSAGSPEVQPQRQEAPRYAEPPRHEQPRYDDRRSDDRHGYSDHGYRKRKKKSFLDDIFDF